MISENVMQKTTETYDKSLFTTLDAGINAFNCVITDSSNNIICAGNHKSGDERYAVIVKYDHQFNLLGITKCKRSFVASLAIDSDDSILCAGHMYLSEVHYSEVFVLRLDSHLQLINQNCYRGINTSRFEKVVVNKLGEIFTVGYTQRNGSKNTSAIVVKLDTQLAIVATFKYSLALADNYFNSVAIDSSNNLIGVGHVVNDRNHKSKALVVRFDHHLNLIRQIHYTGKNSDRFVDVVIDNYDVITCIGTTVARNEDKYRALVVKFNSNLSIIASQHYYDTCNMILQSITNVGNSVNICVGYCSDHQSKMYYACIFQLNNYLSLDKVKVYNSTPDRSQFDNVCVDNDDNIIMVGYRTLPTLDYEIFAAKLSGDNVAGKVECRLKLEDKEIYSFKPNDEAIVSYVTPREFTLDISSKSVVVETLVNNH